MICHVALYNDLKTLTQTNDGFYSTDVVGQDGCDYTIFLYRLASYMDFCNPNALEARGTMFRRVPGSEDWELVCLPFGKFFNWRENPFTMELDFTTAEHTMVKRDGSLISSYRDASGALQLKSKGSIHSQQCVDARHWLTSQPEFEAAIQRADEEGWTVNFEWTSPLNRIVISYQEEDLVILGVRNRYTGEYMNRDEMANRFGENRLVELLDVEDHSTIPDHGDGEGVVVFFGNGAPVKHVKIKTSSYLILHKLKDGVNHPNALFDAVLHDTVDDLRAAFADDGAVITMIGAMEQLVHSEFRAFVAAVDEVCSLYASEDRKGFAVKSQQWLGEHLRDGAGSAFSVAISRHLGLPGRGTIETAFAKAYQAKIVHKYQSQIAEMFSEPVRVD